MGGCSWHHTTTSFVSVHFIVLLCEAVVWFSFDYEKFSSISSLYFRLVVATLKVFEANQIELELRFSHPLPHQHPQTMRQRFVVVYQPLCKSLFVHLLYTAAPHPRITVGWIVATNLHTRLCSISVIVDLWIQLEATPPPPPQQIFLSWSFFHSFLCRKSRCNAPFLVYLVFICYQICMSFYLTSTAKKRWMFIVFNNYL